ncbi:unnamed protein product [Heligmosomoides polygyrus]|uniref:DUF4328 domain-containing protein n=1 Tax=Heligmosomoides polygyrus TaxID=6339 RepID=A0A183FSL5_HELPZ|nr:unnamed protein product [Heligmosomoides polygyrus]
MASRLGAIVELVAAEAVAALVVALRSLSVRPTVFRSPGPAGRAAVVWLLPIAVHSAYDRLDHALDSSAVRDALHWYLASRLVESWPSDSRLPSRLTVPL